MGKKMKLPSIFKNNETKQPWQWPSCKHPKTLSFRAGDGMFKTMNSIFSDPSDGNEVETPESWFTNSSESASFTTESDGYELVEAESLDMVVRGARSERLFFEPNGTKSILEKKKSNGFGYKESVVMDLESEDPYVDFRRSMEEMVECYGSKDWEFLEELLGWYLRVNGKKNHCFIVGAFVDLIVHLSANDAAANADDANGVCFSDSSYYTSAESSFASDLLCSSQEKNELDVGKSMVIS